MYSEVRTLFVEKKPGFDVESQALLADLKDNLSVKGLMGLKVINRYHIAGVEKEEYESIKSNIFSEKTVDYVYDEQYEVLKDEKVFAVEYLPGQYDQRADSAKQCIQLLIKRDEVEVSSAKVIVLSGIISEEDFLKIKNYCINPVDSREASLDKPDSLAKELKLPPEVEVVQGFIESTRSSLSSFLDKYKFAMSLEDLEFCQSYFKNTENRNPTLTELKVIDTYWSDHCRHTTFNTVIKEVEIEEGRFSLPIKKSFEEYVKSRSFVYENREKDMSLMDLAVIGMKELRKKGLLEDLEESEEINACSIEVNVEVEGQEEKWLLMFKNETHNHPTEIEPFGGAATCLGGAIRDPLSGRAYVYQAMRVTGSGDPRQKIEDTISGKLPQRKITIGAAQGYSSYGNQIGLATGQVAELYDEAFTAKRMEIGAVLAAAPKENIVRQSPVPGDVVVIIGGRTGRDGLGGATGSSKEQDEASILTCGAEVQKGNAPTERKLQRLFRNPSFSKLIKKCNDFGAGGAAVAIGELAEGLDINLELMPKKYEGLDGTELALSESQERMAVVVSKENLKLAQKFSEEENLEAAAAAVVTEDNRLRMSWRGNYIVDISRDFLNTNGVKQTTNIKVKSPSLKENYFTKVKEEALSRGSSTKERWLSKLSELNVCSEKGLVERFDSTIGGNTVLMPYGGKYQATPAEGMAAKLPVLKGDTNTVSLMSFGYNPKIGKWSPYHGALYAVVEAAAKITAMGGDYKKIRLTFQEYFERLGKEPEKWGKPFSALLGALCVQKELEIPAIGGKDSMSGSFKELSVPPTLTAFAVCTAEIDNIISPEFKNTDSKVLLLNVPRKEDDTPDFNILKKNFVKVTNAIREGKVLSACSLKHGGIAEAVSKMCFGNRIGFSFNSAFPIDKLFEPGYGYIILELKKDTALEESFREADYIILGTTQEKTVIEINEEELDLQEILKHYESPLEGIFPTKTPKTKEIPENITFSKKAAIKPKVNIAKPRVFIPVFPGTNCEYDSNKAFERAGGTAQNLVFKNLTPALIEASIEEMVKNIRTSQIVMLPGGFSAGDEPDGSGRFIAAVFRNERIKEAVMDLLYNRDGLMLGICNGFQALIKLGLLPYGDIREIGESSPTLTFNKIGRHVSTVVKTKVTSKLSPWLSGAELGDIHWVPVSHGEGRFICSEEEIKRLINNGQVAFQYVDFQGNASMDISHNPNGSYYAVEGITSPDGRILGKMAHSERTGRGIMKNLPGEKDQRIFEAGINYFK